MEVVFKDICYQSPQQKNIRDKLSLFLRGLRTTQPDAEDSVPHHILQNVSGRVGVGESLAIMGPSGCGKTSLLNLLAARSQHPVTSGSIKFGGESRIPRTRRRMGYVMQDDVFFSELTVRETLEFTANIRISDSLSAEDKIKRVDELLNKLKLEKCQHTRIGDQQFDKGISGGERKRLNIANELIHDPELLLADECTSGLDSSSAYAVVDFLHELCLEGKTVIATIHQPSTKMFLMFSKVLLLAAGRVAYFGPPSCVGQYLERLDFPFPGTGYNPAEFMMELIIKDAPRDNEEGSVQSRLLELWALKVKKGKELNCNTDFDNGVKSKDVLSTDVSFPASSSVLQYSDSANDAVVSSDETSSQSNLDSDYDLEEGRKIKRGDTSYGQSHSNQFSILGRMVRATKKRVLEIEKREEFLEEPKYPTSWFSQALVLGRRALLQKRGAIIQPVSLVWVACIVCISGMAWFQMKPSEASIEDRLGFLSFVCVFWSFQTTAASIFAFPSERKVLHKDRASGSYRLSAYYFAKTSVETPADMLYPVMFSIATYFTVGLNPSFVSFLLFTIVLTLTVLGAQSIGLFVSTLVSNVRHAQVFGTLWILFSMLTSGYHIDPDNMSGLIAQLKWLSFIKYSYQAMVRIEMSAGRTFSCVAEGAISTIYSAGGKNCPVTKESLLRGAQLQDSFSIAVNIVILVLWILGIRLLGYFSLKFLHATHKPKLSTWRNS